MLRNLDCNLSRPLFFYLAIPLVVVFSTKDIVSLDTCYCCHKQNSVWAVNSAKFLRAVVQIMVYVEASRECKTVGDKTIFILFTHCCPSSVHLFLPLPYFLTLCYFFSAHLMCASRALDISFSLFVFFPPVFLYFPVFTPTPRCLPFPSPLFSIFRYVELLLKQLWFQILDLYTVPWRKLIESFSSFHGRKRKTFFVEAPENKTIYFTGLSDHSWTN